MIQIAEKIGGNRRNLYLAWHGKRNSYLGYTPIKEQEDIDKYYQPPKPPVYPMSDEEYNEVRRVMWNTWKITMFKNWKRGEPHPKDPLQRITGTAYQIKTHIGIDRANFNKMMESYLGETRPAYSNMWTYKGWRIQRIVKGAISVPQVKIYMPDSVRIIRKEYRRLVVEEYLARTSKGGL